MIRIKRGIYVFAEKRTEIIPEEVSALIYEPSYISMEYALRYYGFIPEAVFAITCISSKANRDFKNIYGYYIYRNLKADLFFGYRVNKTKFGRYLFADPEKALLDFLYLHPEIHNPEDLAGFRFNFELIGKTIDLNKFRFFLGIFNNKRLNSIAEIIIKLCLPSIN